MAWACVRLPVWAWLAKLSVAALTGRTTADSQAGRQGRATTPEGFCARRLLPRPDNVFHRQRLGNQLELMKHIGDALLLGNHLGVQQAHIIRAANKTYR